MQKDDAAACQALTEQGYIRSITEGKLHGYCLDLRGTLFISNLPWDTNSDETKVRAAPPVATRKPSSLTRAGVPGFQFTRRP